MSEDGGEISLHKDAGMSELEWSNLLQAIDTSFVQEKPLEKLKRKCIQEPFIPIGMSFPLTQYQFLPNHTILSHMKLGVGLTVTCLMYGLKCMVTSNVKHSQYAMRGRVIAQAATILAVAAGMLLSKKA